MERLTNKFIIDERPIYTTPNSNITSIPCILTGEDYTGVAIEKLGQLEDLMGKYNVNEKDIEIALILKKIIKNGSVYYEDDSGERNYWYGMGLEFDFETNEIILTEEIDDDYSFKWEEIARLPILNYKKTFWLKEDKSE